MKQTRFSRLVHDFEGLPGEGRHLWGECVPERQVLVCDILPLFGEASSGLRGGPHHLHLGRKTDMRHIGQQVADFDLTIAELTRGRPKFLSPSKADLHPRLLASSALRNDTPKLTSQEYVSLALENRNRSGDRYCVLSANSDNAAEDIEFKCVRLHILVDVPPLHSQYVQRASRSVRQRGHDWWNDSWGCTKNSAACRK